MILSIMNLQLYRNQSTDFKDNSKWCNLQNMVEKSVPVMEILKENLCI